MGEIDQCMVERVLRGVFVWQNIMAVSLKVTECGDSEMMEEWWFRPTRVCIFTHVPHIHREEASKAKRIILFEVAIEHSRSLHRRSMFAFCDQSIILVRFPCQYNLEAVDPISALSLLPWFLQHSPFVLRLCSKFVPLRWGTMIQNNWTGDSNPPVVLRNYFHFVILWWRFLFLVIVFNTKLRKNSCPKIISHLFDLYHPSHLLKVPLDNA